MLILIDGMDLTGKSTLADDLVRQFKLDLVHLGPPKGPSTAEHLRWLPDFADSERGLVVDRSHWSDPVYGPIWHPDNVMSDEAMEATDAIIDDLGGVFIYCTRSIAAIKHKLMTQVDDEHPEVPGIFHHVPELVKAYKRVAAERVRSRPSIPVFVHDFDQAPVNIHAVAYLAAERSTK